MNLESFSRLLDVIILATVLGSGGYAIFIYFRLYREWRILNSFFLRPAQCPPEKCLDTDGYLEYMQPKLLWVGIICILSGILFIPVTLPNLAEIMGLNATIQNILLFGAPMVGFAGLVWYMVCQGKAAKRFWKS